MSETLHVNVIRLVIEMDPQTGGLHVHGPIDNRVLCYGMLEAAKLALANPQQPRVVQAAGPVPFIKPQ
jgi:hypothetical protein